MCGFIMTYGIGKKKLNSAIDSIYHRGPFNHGEVYIDDVNIVMVQLPMKSTTTDVLPVKYQSYYVAYNGEIYDEHATNLQKEIDIAITNINTLQPINGMFALAAYSQERKMITLARDEFGIKPLYYYLNKDRKEFIASSEIKPILELIGSTRPNLSILSEIITLGTQSGEQTCFSNISLLTPGNILNINLNNMEITREYLPPVMPEYHDIDAALDKSIVSCVGDTFRPAALLISDGLDSNLLLTYLDKDISKYNVIVDNNDLNVNGMTYSHIKQTSLTIDNYEDMLKKGIEAYGQPCRMTSILMYQALSDLIAQNSCHMVVTGEGADEIFWGYPRHRDMSSMSLANFNPTAFFFPDLKSNISLLAKSENINYINELAESFKSISQDPLDIIFHMDKKFSLEPLLRRSDHLLMRNTIETRVPFLHFGIPELAKKIGFEKVSNLHNKLNLVKLMQVRNPHYLIKKKQHFRAPLEKWLGTKISNDKFNNREIDALSYLGVSIDKLKNPNYELTPNQFFVLKTMVVWYEKFSIYF